MSVKNLVSEFVKEAPPYVVGADEQSKSMRPGVTKLLPTFGDAGMHDLNILKIISRDLADRLGPLAPKPLPHMVRKYSGDLAIFGKGELLITA